MKRMLAKGWWLCTILLGFGALRCRCAEPEPVPKPVAASGNSLRPAPQPGATSSGARSRRFSFPAAERVVAIGDLHADWEGAVRAFRLAGAIDASRHWAGGKLVVVQTGDELDRGPDGRKILDFVATLSDEAERAGGALHALNGNHETMNVAGDFRYVTPEGFASFSDFMPEGAAFAAMPPAVRGRAAAFSPGGPYANKLAERPAIVMVGDTVFVHGGVLPEHVAYGVDAINDEVAEWMRGKRRAAPASVTSEDSPVWTRAYGAPEVEPGACAMLETALGRLGARRMVVGHTVQQGGITAACDAKVFRIDVGIAKYYGRHVEVLELSGDRVRVLSETAPPAPALEASHAPPAP